MKENSEPAELVGAVEVTDDEIHHTDDETPEFVSLLFIKKVIRNYFRKKKHLSSTDVERIHYRFVNDRVVNDITLEVLYKPHTITLLVLLCGFLLYKAFAE